MFNYDITFYNIVQRSCGTAEDECLHYKSLYEKSQEEMKELTERHAQVSGTFTEIIK